MVWGATSVKDLVGYDAFKRILGGAYYARILEDHPSANIVALLNIPLSKNKQDNHGKSFGNLLYICVILYRIAIKYVVMLSV